MVEDGGQNCFFYGSNLLKIANASPRGRIARIPNLRAAFLKCVKLKVTIKAAWPLTAVSKIISSPGSLSSGRHEK
jgi:hypothetical protein